MEMEAGGFFFVNTLSHLVFFEVARGRSGKGQVAFGWFFVSHVCLHLMFLMPETVMEMLSI